MGLDDVCLCRLSLVVLVYPVCSNLARSLEPFDLLYILLEESAGESLRRLPDKLEAVEALNREDDCE